jgi:hypothetical protein
MSVEKKPAFETKALEIKTKAEAELVHSVALEELRRRREELKTELVKHFKIVPNDIGGCQAKEITWAFAGCPTRSRRFF